MEVKINLINTEDIVAEREFGIKVNDCYKLSLLAESIRENGLLEPLLVAPLENGKYKLVLGARRLRAAGIAGIKKVPCVITEIDQVTADGLLLTEILRRGELNFFFEAESIMRFIKKHRLSLLDTASQLETTVSAIERKLLLLNLDEKIRQSIAAARLSERHASALLRLSLSERQEALKFIIANKLTATETEEYIEGRIFPKTAEQKSKCVIGDVRLFENSLSKLADTARKGGISVDLSREETESHIEYTVVIKKQGLGTS